MVALDSVSDPMKIFLIDDAVTAVKGSCRVSAVFVSDVHTLEPSGLELTGPGSADTRAGSSINPTIPLTESALMGLGDRGDRLKQWESTDASPLPFTRVTRSAASASSL